MFETVTYSADCDKTSSPVYTLSKGLKWESTTGSNILPGAVVGGHRYNGETLYVTRVLADGIYHPGKRCASCISPGSNYCYNNDETISSEYDLLVINTTMTSVAWEEVTTTDYTNGDIPSNVLVAEGDGLYVCRASQSNELIPGELDPVTGVCTVVTRGQCYQQNSYEVLVATPASG